MSMVSFFSLSAQSLELQLVHDLTTGAQGSNPAFPTLLDNRLVFVALNASHECNENTSQVLWVTNGTNEGTHILDSEKVFGSGCQDWGFEFTRCVAGQKLFYLASFGPGQLPPSGEIWVTRGWPGDIDRIVLDSDIHMLSPWSSVEEKLLVNTSDGLVASDGTPEGTVQIWGSSALSPMGNGFFLWRDDTHSVELAFTDGTAAGTRGLDIQSGPEGSRIDVFTLLTLAGGRSRIFWASDGVHGQEPWVSDGTVAGTYMMKDLSSTGDSCPLFTAGDGHVGYFALAMDGACRFDPWTQEYGVWITNGTEDGTTFVAKVPLPLGFRPGGHPLQIVQGGKLFVFGDDPEPSHGPGELWVSDGTQGGTKWLKSFVSVEPIGFVGFGESVAFVADDGIHGNELWVSDGSEAGTYLVGDLVAGPEGSEPAEIVSWEDRLVFSAWTPDHGRELWMTDGSSRGTVMVADLCAGPCSSDPGWHGHQRGFGGLKAGAPVVLGDMLLFPADDGIRGRELWAVRRLDDIHRVSFHRGDPNSSGTIDISDSIAVFGYLFLGNIALGCRESADVNNSGTIDIADGIYVLNWLFTGGPEPAVPGVAPGPCGLDPDPPGSAGDLGCEVYQPCP